MPTLENFANLHENKPLLKYVNDLIALHDLSVKSTDLNRPWGGFYAFDEKDAEDFVNLYFQNLKFDTYENLSPKFLLVGPNMRLSWQWHYLRSELWNVVQGPVGVKISQNDTEPDKVQELNEGDTIQFDARVRHRLIGSTKEWGVVAEIWKHTNPLNHSSEADIVRIQDDFKRN